MQTGMHTSLFDNHALHTSPSFCTTRASHTSGSSRLGFGPCSETVASCARVGGRSRGVTSRSGRAPLARSAQVRQKSIRRRLWCSAISTRFGPISARIPRTCTARSETMIDHRRSVPDVAASADACHKREPRHPQKGGGARPLQWRVGARLVWLRLGGREAGPALRAIWGAT